MKIVIAAALLIATITAHAGRINVSRMGAKMMMQQYLGKKVTWIATDGYGHSGIVEDVITPLWGDASADGIQLKVMETYYKDGQDELVGHEIIEAYLVVAGSEWLGKRVQFKDRDGVNYAGTVENVHTGGIIFPSDNEHKPSAEGIFHTTARARLVVRELVTDDPDKEVPEWMFVDNLAAPSYDYQGIEGEANHPTQQIGRLFKFRNPQAPAEQLIGRALVIHTSGWYEFEVVAVQEDDGSERELHDQHYILLISKEHLAEAVPYQEL